MIKQTLGKIFIIVIFAINIFANVTARVDTPAIYKGDSINLTISADGNDIKFPEIDEIDSNPIDGTSSSQSTTIINGSMSKSVSKTYSFRPQKSLTIPSYEVEVDGKTYTTDEIKVSVLKPTASKAGSDFIVQMSADKRDVHVGESINLTISFKQKLNAHAQKLQLGEPELENFWVKKVDNVEKSNEGDYIVQKVHYILFPQKEGKYTIPAIQASIGTPSRQRRNSRFNDPFFDDPFFSSFTRQLSWQKIFSNELNINVKPLPNNLELFGDYEIQAEVDKREVSANKPVNLTIRVRGKGNIDDIKKFNLDIENAIIYADEPKITSNIYNNIYQGEFTQKIAIIADSNFTIDPIKLEYFDKETNQTKTIQTEPIDIVVKGGSKAEKQPTIEVSKDIQTLTQSPKTNISAQKTVFKEEKSYIKYLFLAIGLILGLLISYIFNRFQNRGQKTEPDIIKEIKKAKNDRQLFDILLPYSNKDKIISNTLNKLEENIYKNSNHKIDKDELMDFFEDNQ